MQHGFPLNRFFASWGMHSAYQRRAIASIHFECHNMRLADSRFLPLLRKISRIKTVSTAIFGQCHAFNFYGVELCDHSTYKFLAHG